MSDHRIPIWRWLTRGVPVGQMLPRWLIGCHWILFPRRSLLWWLQRDCGFDLLGGWWTIHGVRFSDQIFLAMARPRPDMLYRFEREPGSSLVTIVEARIPTTDPHHGSPAMTDPNRPPLWREMAGAWSARVIVGRPDAERLAIAAEIRALRDWIEKRQVDEYGITLPDVREVIGWLTAEADRAERGDDD